MPPTQDQLNARLNPTSVQLSLPGSGLYRSANGEALYNIDGKNVTSALLGNIGGHANPALAGQRASMGAAVPYLSSLGIDFNNLPTLSDAQLSNAVSMGYQQNSINSNTGGLTNASLLSAWGKGPVAGPATTVTANGPEVGRQNTIDLTKNVISVAQAAIANRPPMTQIGSAITPPTQSGSPTLPTAQGTTAVASYVTGVAGSIQNYATQLNAANQAQVQKFQTQLDTLNQNKEQLQQMQELGLSNEGSLALQEHQQQADALQQEQQQYQDLYNQKSTIISKMTDLANSAGATLTAIAGQTGLKSILDPQNTAVMANVTGQMGLYKSVLDALDGAIGSAQTQLNDASRTITAMYTDQLSYWQNVVDFYKGQQSSTESQITSLTKEEQSYIDDQMKTIQNQMKTVQDNADLISKAMLDPKTATAYAMAGVSLTDTPPQIAQKLANYNTYVANSQPKTATKVTVAPGSKIISGTLSYTQADRAADSTALENSRGSDGYVDPSLYLKLYNAWTSAGGTAVGFTSTYPPKDYVNPANTWLPSFLVPKSSNSLQSQIDALHL
jgi:hypothetical protein